jgi:hypothetical protein
VQSAPDPDCVAMTEFRVGMVSPGKFLSPVFSGALWAATRASANASPLSRFELMRVPELVQKVTLVSYFDLDFKDYYVIVRKPNTIVQR